MGESGSRRSAILGPGPLILVAVGTQFPFDRLVQAVDDWAGARNRDDVVAQIGPSALLPKHIRSHAFLPPRAFQSMLEQCNLLVAHCGMGSILSALSLGKPILVMPRSAARGEHRNDHQLATAKRFLNRPGVTVADNETELVVLLDRHASTTVNATGITPIPPKAPRELTDRLRGFLLGGTLRETGPSGAPEAPA